MYSYVLQALQCNCRQLHMCALHTDAPADEGGEKACMSTICSPVLPRSPLARFPDYSARANNVLCKESSAHTKTCAPDNTQRPSHGAHCTSHVHTGAYLCTHASRLLLQASSIGSTTAGTVRPGTVCAVRCAGKHTRMFLKVMAGVTSLPCEHYGQLTPAPTASCLLTMPVTPQRAHKSRHWWAWRQL